MYKDNEEKYVLPSEIEKFLLKGWQLGNNPKANAKNKKSNSGKNHYAFGKCFVIKDQERKLIPKEDLTYYISKGWLKGRNLR